MILAHHTSLTNITGKVNLWKAFNKVENTTHVPQGSIVGVTET
jgi:hypothetical protein